MICDYGYNEQIFLGIKEKAEVKSTIEKCVQEYVEEDPEIVERLGDIDVSVMAEDFKGRIKNIDKATTLNYFFNSNKKTCYFPLCEICSLSKIKVTI